MSELRSGVKRDYVPDPLGSTVALLDSTQTKTDTFGYWPYGESAARTGTTATPFQFVGAFGYYQNSPTRSYVRARHLDLGKTRWLTEDPTGFYGGINFFAYAAGSPVLNFDPSGERPALPFPPKVWPGFNWPPAPYPTKPPPHHIPGDYGHHCGLYVRTTPPGKKMGNEDCIDESCRIHDMCIDNNRNKCLREPGYIDLCDNFLCNAAKSCLSECKTWQCKIQSGKVAAYFCLPGGGSYIKWPDWTIYPPMPPILYPRS